MGDLAAVVVGRSSGGSRDPVLGLRPVLPVRGVVTSMTRLRSWLSDLWFYQVYARWDLWVYRYNVRRTNR